MKISCPSCAAKYSITDEKVRDRLAKIRCRKCGTTIVIDGKVDPPHVTAAASQPAPSDAGGEAGYNEGDAETGPAPGDYSVDMGDDDQRSMSVQQIIEAYQRGEVNETTYVWADGMIDWQRIADVAELSTALGLNATDAPPESVSRASTRSGAGRGSAADLFGGIESAGSEDDITTSAPEPVVAPAATGARNESSVLFSLSALTGSATPTAPLAVPSPSFPPKATTSVSSEDSGLIDLKALTATINTPGGGSDAMLVPGVSPLHLGAPPLGMAAPLGSVGSAVPAIDTADAGRGRSGGKGAIFVGAAILVVGLAAVAAFAMRGGDDEIKPEAAAAAAPAPTATVAPTQATTRPTAAPVKTAETIAQPPPTGTAAAADPPATKPAAPTAAATAAKATSSTSSSGTTAKSKKPSTSGSSSSASSGSSSSSSASTSGAAAAPTPAPAAEPKKKKCDCKPGDLMCAMRCSAK